MSEMQTPPDEPKLYHIVHVDRLASIAESGGLLCDAELVGRAEVGTGIGMTEIKQRRLSLPISCRPGLRVGDCVPFYFCPRSVMLYLIHRANHPNLTYRGGQGPIVHLEVDLKKVVKWANDNGRRWAFTLSNAGANYFEDRCDLRQMNELAWDSISATLWSGPGVANAKEGKQAEFLVENTVPWDLIGRIGVLSADIEAAARRAIRTRAHRPPVEIRRDWYY